MTDIIDMECDECGERDGLSFDDDGCFLCMDCLAESVMENEEACNYCDGEIIKMINWKDELIECGNCMGSGYKRV